MDPSLQQVQTRDGEVLQKSIVVARVQESENKAKPRRLPHTPAREDVARVCFVITIINATCRFLFDDRKVTNHDCDDISCATVIW